MRIKDLHGVIILTSRKLQIPGKFGRLNVPDTWGASYNLDIEVANRPIRSGQ